MKKNELLILSAIVLFSLIRLVNLDADPGMFKRMEDIGDEGYWGNAARNLVLYNQYITDEFTLDSATAPLYTFFTFLFFKALGVSSYALRLTSVIFGILTILLAYVFLRKYNKNIALWGALFLAINYNYFQYNRIGHVETLVTFFILLAFFLFESKGHWFAGGLSYGVAVAAKMSALYFAPAILVYFIFRLIRKEMQVRNVLLAALGGLAIGAVLLIYQYYFWDSFRVMYQEAAKGNILSIKDLLLQLPADIVRINDNQFLKNPINVFLVVCLALYLWRIRFLSILSRNILPYIRKLGPLDIVVTSWIFGYVITLLLTAQFYDDRRLQLLSVVLSFIPAILVFSNKAAVNFNPTANFFQRLVFLFPVVLAGREVFEVIGNRLFAFPGGAVVGILLSLAVVLVLSAVYKHLNGVTQRIVKIISLVSFVFVIVLQFSSHLAQIAQIASKTFNLLAILIFTLALGIFAYYALRRVSLIRLVYGISLALIVLELATPAFSIRNASNELNRLTSKDDYLIGIRGHMLSYNAQYHPIWWWLEPSNYAVVNMEFVKAVKPKYLLLRTERYGRPEDLKTYPLMPLSKAMNHIGASKIEKVSSFGLFPAFGKDRERYEVYRISY